MNDKKVFPFSFPIFFFGWIIIFILFFILKTESIDLLCLRQTEILCSQVTITTVISGLQGASGYKVYHFENGLKSEKSADKVLLNIWCNFGKVVADEQNMETYVRRRGICCNTGNRNIQFILPFTKI